MKIDNESPTLFQYDEPDLDEADVTEADFREAIAFLVAIQPPEKPMDGLESYQKALEPYAFDIRQANRTLERYAIMTLWYPKAIQECFYKYVADPTFFRDDLPRSTVGSILRIG